MSLETLSQLNSRVAEELTKKHSGDLDREVLFEEAKRIVTAEYQHIIYNEWLPIVLGKGPS